MGFHPLRALRALFEGPGAPASPPPLDPTHDLKAAYVGLVDELKARMPHEQAMEHAIGAGFDEIGPMEAGIVLHYGLPRDGYLIDVGCGSGRLAKPLAARHPGRYLGVDLASDLLDHARKVAARPDWRFEEVDHIAIPEADGVADMVCFFSVLTHLLHEQSYWYLEEARRVLKPGGRIVFSFLEFTEPWHFRIFLQGVEAAKARERKPLDVFIDRAAIPVWAESLGLVLEEIRGGNDVIAPEGNLGQAICVLRKP
jgi:ubiquinone/menaquinone biosynthesis C-methylase UbiE